MSERDGEGVIKLKMAEKWMVLGGVSEDDTNGELVAPSFVTQNLAAAKIVNGESEFLKGLVSLGQRGFSWGAEVLERHEKKKR